MMCNWPWFNASHIYHGQLRIILRIASISLRRRCCGRFSVLLEPSFTQYCLLDFSICFTPFQISISLNCIFKALVFTNILPCPYLTSQYQLFTHVPLNSSSTFSKQLPCFSILFSIISVAPTPNHLQAAL